MSEMSTRRLQDPFYKTLISMVLPITIQQLMMALVSATDAIMLGLVDQTSLSSVSLATQVQFVLSLFVGGIAGGLGILAAQYWGKQDRRTIEQLVPIALRLTLLLGAVFTAAALFLPQQLMFLFTGEQELVVCGGQYLRAVAFSYLLFSISQVYLNLLKNTGRVAISSRISAVTVVLNIILNAIFIFGLFGLPAFGIVGAAYATVISRLIELLWAAAETRREDAVHVRWNQLFYTDRLLAKDFWSCTMPLLGAWLVWGVAYVLYSVIMGHMGSDAVAANSVASIVKSLLFCLCEGIASGTGIMVGNLLGAGRLEQAKAYAARLTKLTIVVGAITGGLLAALSPLIVTMAPVSDEAGRYLQAMLLFSAVYIVAKAANGTVLNGIFCAGGDAKFDMLGNVGAMWLFTVPFGFLAAFGLKWSVLAVYCIINLDEIVKLPAVFLHYRKYIWLKDLTREQA